jgi:hypothetical protein
MTSIQFDWSKMKNIQKIHRVLYALGFGPLIGRIILLLTTMGRKSGLLRVTPLQYEEINGDYYLGAVCLVIALAMILADKMWKRLPSDHPAVYQTPELAGWRPSSPVGRERKVLS